MGFDTTGGMGMEENNWGFQDATQQEESQFPSSRFMIALGFGGDLTYLPLGPSVQMIIPLVVKNRPFAYLAVVFIDIILAIAVKPSLSMNSQYPTPFETAWRHSLHNSQGQYMPDQHMPVQNVSFIGGNSSAPSADEATAEQAAMRDPLFPPGIGISLLLETPFPFRSMESSTIFWVMLVDLAKAPIWLVLVASAIIHIFSHLGYNRNK
jgi:hypothetical protein